MIKRSPCLMKCDAVNTWGLAEVSLSTFWISSLDTSERSASLTGALLMGKSPRYPLYRRLCRPQGQSGLDGGEKISCFCRESNPDRTGRNPILMKLSRFQVGYEKGIQLPFNYTAYKGWVKPLCLITWLICNKSDSLQLIQFSIWCNVTLHAVVLQEELHVDEIRLMCAGNIVLCCYSRGVLKLELKLMASSTNLRNIFERKDVLWCNSPFLNVFVHILYSCWFSHYFIPEITFYFKTSQGEITRAHSPKFHCSRN